MISLIKMCFKESIYSSKMILPQGILMVFMILFIGITNVSMIFGFSTLLISALAMSLKTKEKQECWRHLFFTLAGPDKRFAIYIHLYLLLLAVAITLTGICTLLILAALGTATFSMSEVLILTGAVNGVLFYRHLQLLICEFIAADQILYLENISIFLVLGLLFLGNYLGIKPTGLILFELSVGIALFNYYGVFLLAEAAYRRKTRLAIQ